MSNFKSTDLGAIKDLIKLENGKAFLHDALGLTSCEISLNTAPKGFKVPFNHKHKQNEEIYIILKGEGVITVDGEQIPVKEGSCVKVGTGAARTIENAADGEMSFICIQAKENSLEQFGFADAELC